MNAPRASRSRYRVGSSSCQKIKLEFADARATGPNCLSKNQANSGILLVIQINCERNVVVACVRLVVASECSCRRYSEPAEPEEVFREAKVIGKTIHKKNNKRVLSRA